jgi:hypothetical protein
VFVEDVDASFGADDGEAVARHGLEDLRWWRRTAWRAASGSRILDLGSLVAAARRGSGGEGR